MTDKRVSQVATEVVSSGVPRERVSQVATETVFSGVPSVRFSQSVTEVIYVVGASTARLGRSYVIG